MSKFKKGINEEVATMINDYPTQRDINYIKKWSPLKKSMKEIREFLEFIREIWWMPDWGFKLKGKKTLYLELHTGGWSGNEDLVQALHLNNFWTLYWQKEIRGGHYFFTIRETKSQNKGMDVAGLKLKKKGKERHVAELDANK